MGSVPTLQYPDVPARWGIATESDARRFRLVVPPVPGWRYLSPGYLAATAFLTMVTLAMSLGSAKRGTFEPALIVYAPALAITLCVGAYRLTRWLTIEVTARHLGFVPRRALGGLTAARWPRRDVREVKMNPYNGKLIVRVHGQEMLEVYISPSREVTAYVARMVAEALGREFEVPANHLDVPPVPPIASPRRLALCAVATGVAVAAPVLTAIFRPAATGHATVAALVFLATAFGLTFGTQRKDFWM